MSGVGIGKLSKLPPDILCFPPSSYSFSGRPISPCVMAQYFPTYKAKEDPLLNRKLTQKEYKQVEQYLYSLNLENGYIQELGKHEEEYVPEFDFSE